MIKVEVWDDDGHGREASCVCQKFENRKPANPRCAGRLVTDEDRLERREEPKALEINARRRRNVMMIYAFDLSCRPFVPF